MNKNYLVIFGVFIACLAALFFSVLTPQSYKAGACLLIALGLVSAGFSKEIYHTIDTWSPWGYPRASPTLIFIWSVGLIIIGISRFFKTPQ